MLLEIGRTLGGNYYCCEIDEYNGERHHFVYGNSYEEVSFKKSKSIEKRNIQIK